MADTVSSGSAATTSATASVTSGATVTPPRPAVAPAPAARPSAAPVGITKDFTKAMRGELQDMRRIAVANMDRKMRERLAELEAAEKPYLEARAKAAAK